MCREKRLATPAIHAAVVARDMHCVFPSCDRRSSWCDTHHIEAWSMGGETRIENLALLCRHHHTLVHEGGWEVEGAPGRLRFLRPDGTELGAPPPRHPVAKVDEAAGQRGGMQTPDIRARLAELPRPRGP